MSGRVKDRCNPFDPLFDVFARTNDFGVRFELTKCVIRELISNFPGLFKDSFNRFDLLFLVFAHTHNSSLSFGLTNLFNRELS